MQDTHQQFEQRKRDHIALALLPDNQASEWNALDSLRLWHEALPELDLGDIRLDTFRLGCPVTTPFLASSMTAGHKDAMAFNRNLMQACAERGWAMGVGSQRRELSDPDASCEWQPLVRDFPHVERFGNIGLAQLISSPLPAIEQLVDNLSARAMIVHCNPLQECIQPEGTPRFRGGLAAIGRLVKALSVPVIVKETGCGFSPTTLAQLNELGVAAVDVSGLGGTHWGRIESQRAGKNPHTHAGELFRDWGIDTVTSIRHAVAANPTFEIWGSGGVRHGLDAARLIALGASTIGVARPLLEGALKSAEAVSDTMAHFESALKIALFCTGSPSPYALRGKLCP